MSRKGLRVRGCLLILAGVLLAGCQGTGPTSSSEQDYFTWVDDQGRVQQSPIIREPAEKPAADVADHSGESSEPSEPGRTVAPADPEFNLENYPDGNQLERDGYIRPGEPQPYFTWRDAEGNIRVNYYQPDTRSAVEKGRIKPPVELTPASIYQQGNGEAQAAPREGGDPDAFAILGIEQPTESYLVRWQRHCCDSLDTGAAEDWQSGREFGLNIDDASPVHGFITGHSPYLLVRLPTDKAKRGYIMRIRSFAKDGLFVPSAAFLDGNLKPVRVVTDMVADYVPESWHRRGYLEAHVPVFPEHGERWLVIYTRDEDTQGQTVVEGTRGPRAIPHVIRGELSLTELRER